MNEYDNGYDNAPAVRGATSLAPVPSQAVASQTSQVALQERLADSQMRYMMARQFPRRIEMIEQNVKNACQQFGLAELAEYALPVSGSTVRGPSIRLAEALAQAYGNLDVGREVIATGRDDRAKWSDVRVYALDLETGLRIQETIRIHHVRYSKTKGDTHIGDLGELERIFSQHAAKRLRECILRVLPRDLINKGRAWCQETVKKGAGNRPLMERIKAMVIEFERQGVKREQLEKRAGCGIDLWTDDHFSEMRAVFVSLREGATSVEDWFETGEASAGETAERMKAQVAARKASVAKEGELK